MPLGLVAGYAGGKIDSVIMRVLDAILAFPVILLAILVVATLGTETINLMLTIGFVFIPYFTRLVRGNVLALKEREFVEASRASGAGDALSGDPRHPAEHPLAHRRAGLTDDVAGGADRGRPELSRTRRAGADAGLGLDAAELPALSAAAPWFVLSPASASSSPSWPSTSSATDCATSSTCPDHRR